MIFLIDEYCVIVFPRNNPFNFISSSFVTLETTESVKDIAELTLMAPKCYTRTSPTRRVN